MSEKGQKLKSNRPLLSSALTSTADITHQGCEVRKVPEADMLVLSEIHAVQVVFSVRSSSILLAMAGLKVALHRSAQIS